MVLTSDNPRTRRSAGDFRRNGGRRAQTGVKKFSASRLESSVFETRNPKSETERGYCVEADRRAAIRIALRVGAPGDLVLIAGKGHEDYQILGTNKIHFDDREVAREEAARVSA